MNQPPDNDGPPPGRGGRLALTDGQKDEILRDLEAVNERLDLMLAEPRSNLQ